MSALAWSLRHFKSMDEANAAVHCAPVKYSPITFACAEAVIAMFGNGSDEATDALEVLAHRGAYELDAGR